MRLSSCFLFISGLFLTLSANAAEPKKDSIVNLSWQQTLRRELYTGSAQMVVESDLEHVPVSDVRAKLKGKLLSIEVLENCGGLNQSGVTTSPFMNSDQISLQSRCFWNVACIVDDVPVPFNHFLFDPNQIESMTFISDIADKVALGPVASKGAFYIRTKKGGYNTPLRMSFDIESGVQTQGIWPEFVNGEQYAIMQNLAREQAGYDPIYTAEDIKGFANGDPFDLKYPCVDYRTLFYNRVKPVSRFGFNATAGSNNIKFNVSLNGLTGKEFIKLGPQNDYSKLNLTSSVSAKIGRYLEATASFNGLLSFNQGSNGGDVQSANITGPVLYPLVLQVDPDSEYYDPTVMGGTTTIYGVSREEAHNPYAAVLESGYSRTKRRSGLFNAKVDFDMSWLLPGLKSQTFASIETFFVSTIGKNEDYLAFYWDKNHLIDGRSTVHLGNKTANESVLSNATFQSLNAFERLSYDWNKGNHLISANLTGSIVSAASTAKTTNTRLLSGIGAIKYAYADKYIVDLSANYSGTTLFYSHNKYGFFPAAGLSWVASNENFIKNISWINWLKLHAQAGKTGDIDIYGTSDNMWNSIINQNESKSYHFGPLNGASWFGQLIDYLASTGYGRFSNKELTWPVITEVDAGLDATLFNCLDLNFIYYHARQSGVITNIAGELSTTFGHVGGGGVTEYSTGQYYNHDVYTYKGWELGLRWHQDWKDWGAYVGVSGRHWDKINDVINNDFYRYEYQKQTGRHASEVYGFVYDGRFTSEEEIASSPLYSTNTKIGDIKYKDLNDDGRIDANDKMFLAPGNAKLRYSIDLGLRYKNLDFNVIGVGQAGFKTYLSSIYFMGGHSINNYSKFMWDNLVRDENGNPTAIGDKFPRLDYFYNSGNFSCSEYWLRDGGWFKIQSAEIGYNVNMSKVKWVESLRLSLRASNLGVFSKIEYIDPEAPVSGILADPLYRTLTFGAKFIF